MRLVALHTTEGILKNSDLRAFFDRPAAAGSSHASADRTGLLEAGFVPYDRAAWTLRSGNPISDNLEQCGFAQWTRERWLTTEIGTINAAALWVYKRCTARGIPIRYLTHAQLRAGEAGVIQHNDWSIAMRDGTHWDCGPGYPIDVVIDKARRHGGTQPQQQEDDMSVEFERDVRSMWKGMTSGGLAALGKDLRLDLAHKQRQLDVMAATLARIEAKLAASQPEA